MKWLITRAKESDVFAWCFAIIVMALVLFIAFGL